MKIFALAGQSNMCGVSPVPLFQHASPNILAWINGAWRPATEPLHTTYAGPGLAFAQALLTMHPDWTVGLVPCAVSGTSITQWQRGQTVYTDAVAKTNAARGSECLAGVLFSQGEADTFTTEAANGWATLALSCFRDFRTDTGKLETPLLYAQLGADPGDPARVGWSTLQTAQASLNNPAVYPWLRMVKTDGLAVTAQHFATYTEYTAVGARYASKFFENWG